MANNIKNNEEPEQEVPDVESEFADLLRRHRVKGDMIDAIARNIAKTGGAKVFETPRRLADRLTKWSQYINPVKRSLILEEWFSDKNIALPEELLKEVEMSAAEKEKHVKETTEAESKYSVDTDTGAIKVASTTDKTALTWDEAEKLSKEIKKDIEAREKKSAKASGGEEEKLKAKFYVDPEDGAIRPAKGDEERLTWGEAEQVADRIKKEKGKEGKEGKESPFIIDDEGKWKLNPKAPIGGLELLAFEAVRKSQERGEPLDPFEVMKERAKDVEMIRSVFGGGREGGGMGDFVEVLLKVKELTGADEETKNLLAGIYKLMKEGEGGRGESEEVKTLREELKGLRNDLANKEKERLDEQISSLSTALSEVRADLAKARADARATDEYGIMSEAIKMVDRRLGAIEGTVRGALGRPPGLLPPGTKKELTEAISEEAVEEGALDQLAGEVLYQR